MPLTKAQREERTRYCGASDVPAIVGVSPWKTALDLWLRKRRGKNLELAPIVTEDEPDPDTCDAFDPFVETDKRTTGTLMENGIVALYCHRTGFSVRRSKTMKRKDAPWQAATPDRLVLRRPRGKVERGLETKLVGRWAVAGWEGAEGVPEHVRVQAQWSMYVTDHDVWDVAALLNGTEFKIVRVERDEELIEELLEHVIDFWEGHVLANRPPPAADGDDAYRYVSTIYPRATAPTKVASPTAEKLARDLVLAQHDKKEAEARVKRITALLCAMCGDAKSIKSDNWTFSWAEHNGAPLWAQIAARLAPHGAIPQALLDELRAADYRKPQLHPKKAWKEGIIAHVEAQMEESHDAADSE